MLESWYGRREGGYKQCLRAGTVEEKEVTVED